MRRIAAAAVISVLVPFVLAVPASAAAPHYILVSGPTLKRPALLPNWRENHSLLLAILEATPAQERVPNRPLRRPRFDVALFWVWSSPTAPKRPRAGDQHGSFYPAYRTHPALIRLTVSGIDRLKIAPPIALKILARHGVPIRL
jgi:hypothetical protein